MPHQEPRILEKRLARCSSQHLRADTGDINVASRPVGRQPISQTGLLRSGPQPMVGTRAGRSCHTTGCVPLAATPADSQGALQALLVDFCPKPNQGTRAGPFWPPHTGPKVYWCLWPPCHLLKAMSLGDLRGHGQTAWH